MKIYFTAAISQKDQYGSYYQTIIHTLEKEGHVVQHEQVTKKTMAELEVQTDDDRVKYYRQAMRWLTQADVVVVEGSFPSTLNIGHEITLALGKGKPVIVLYKKGKNSFFLDGLNSEKLFLSEYTDENLAEMVKDSLDYAKDQTDTRFNFFITPSLSHYLDWIANYKKIPRSVYLRRLIEEDREKHRELYEGS